MLVRHAQSVGNVAREKAEAAGLRQVELNGRDVDIPLSKTGEDQAIALGEWLKQLPLAEKPEAVISSPYVRALATAAIALDRAGDGMKDTPLITDERLREREFGLIDRLTQLGIKHHYPEQAELKTRLKKFYYRPPGGESWCDIILRLRSFLDTLNLEYPNRRVMIVCHSAVILCFRYLFENMTEAEILRTDRQTKIPNCAVTSYDLVQDRSLSSGGQYSVKLLNFTAPIVQGNVPVSIEPVVSQTIFKEAK